MSGKEINAKLNEDFYDIIQVFDNTTIKNINDWDSY